LLRHVIHAKTLHFDVLKGLFQRENEPDEHGAPSFEQGYRYTGVFGRENRDPDTNYSVFYGLFKEISVGCPGPTPLPAVLKAKKYRWPPESFVIILNLVSLGIRT
jgi:hypothetical protein